MKRNPCPHAIGVLLVAAAFLCANPEPTAAQATVDPEATALEGPASCQQNCFNISPLTTIGDRSGPAMLPGLSRLAFDSRGRVFVVAAEVPGEIWVYDRAGALVQRMERLGAGPGEFQQIDWIHVASGDTLHVFDRLNGRHNVLGPDLQFVRSTPFRGAVTDAVSLTNGRLVVSARINSTESVGLPLHLLDAQGHLERSFGAHGGFYRGGGMERFLERRLARAGTDSFWSVSRTGYTIELWNFRGERLRAMRRVVDWFEPYVRHRSITLEDPPQPSVNSVHMDAEGRLWILSYVAEEDYSEGLQQNNTPEGVGYSFETPEEIFATRIEVVDPRSQRVIASERLPTMFGMLVEDALMMAISEDDLGVRYIDFYRIQLNEGVEE